MYIASQVWISTLRYWCILHTLPFSKGIFCLWTLNMRSISQILWQNAFNISAGLINLFHLFCSLLFIVKYWSGTSRDCEDSSQMKVIYGTTRTLMQKVLLGAVGLQPWGFSPSSKETQKKNIITMPDHQPVGAPHCFKFSDLLFFNPFFTVLFLINTSISHLKNTSDWWCVWVTNFKQIHGDIGYSNTAAKGNPSEAQFQCQYMPQIWTIQG